MQHMHFNKENEMNNTIDEIMPVSSWVLNRGSVNLEASMLSGTSISRPLKTKYHLRAYKRDLIYISKIRIQTKEVYSSVGMLIQ